MAEVDKTVIITGGNSGLGFETARAILRNRDGWYVVIAGRSRQRCQVAASRLRYETGTPSAEAMVLDLASLAAVRQFALDFSTGDRPPLRALVCNAGVQIVGPTQRTDDGFESTFGVNHLGHFLLANLMLPHLKAPGRIIFVSSGTHDPGQRSGMPEPLLKHARSLAARRRRTGGSQPPRLRGATAVHHLETLQRALHLRNGQAIEGGRDEHA